MLLRDHYPKPTDARTPMTDLAYSASWPHAGHFARNGSGSCSTDSKSSTARNSENGSLQFSQAAPGRLNPAEEPLITPTGLIGCSGTPLEQDCAPIGRTRLHSLAGLVPGVRRKPSSPSRL